MHVQELELLARQRIKLLTCTPNDGAYSAEVHKLVPAGVDPGEAIFGRPDLAAIAKAFGLADETVASDGKLRDLFAAHERADRSTVWDVHVSGKVVSQPYRCVFWGENGLASGLTPASALAPDRLAPIGSGCYHPRADRWPELCGPRKAPERWSSG